MQTSLYFACVDELSTKGRQKKRPIWNALALTMIGGLVAAPSSC